MRRSRATTRAIGSKHQEVVLTVPASFDEAARELTVEAAKRAGFANLTLLEEPQAAFYCWIVTHQEGWQKQVRGGELILVCDIGGGTTDFSLITVVETPTGPGFRRVAVGDHLMLGGDNIDLALAHRVEAKLGGARLDAEQWNALRLACRTAKEKLWGENSPARWPVTIAGRGSKIIGGSIQSELTRDEVREVVLDGFFPPTGRDEDPVASGEGGLAGVRPAVRRRPGHPQAPRRRSSGGTGPRRSAQGGIAADDRPARPDAILFNGGALTPDFVRERIVDVVASWFPDEPGRAVRAARPDERLARPGRGDRRGLLRGRPARRRHPDRRRHGPVVLRRVRVGVDATSPGSASSRATPRRGTRSRSPTTTSTC